MSYFSERIKKLRLNNNLTQKEIAQKIGISQGNYSGLESGKYDPSLTTLQSIADFYEEFIDALVRPIRIVDEITEEERLMLKQYSRLPGKDQFEIERIIEIKLAQKKEEDDEAR